jgi:hypothetical protein
MFWENDYTNVFEVRELVYFELDLGSSKTASLHSTWALSFAGLGVGLEEVQNKPHSEIDWGQLDRLKLKRAREYKKIIYDGLNIPAFVTNDEINDPSFSRWIYKNNH